jgi:L-lactate dehydrogenase (cytochrome)
MSSLAAARRAITISDLRDLARKRLPQAVFDYVDGGADAEITLRENCAAFEGVRFRPKNAVRIRSCDLETHVLGQELKLPFVLAPIGTTRLIFPLGEALAASAASEAGTAYTLSTFGGTTIEEVRATAAGPLWFQLYLVGGREASLAAIERARKAGFTTLAVTIDTAVAGMRERDFRNGTQALLSRRPLAMLPYLGQFMTRPRWIARFIADGGLMNFPNVVLPSGPMKYADVAHALEEATVTWEDLRWIRDSWPGKLVIKGVLTGEDALRALDWGADGVIVSNHGGRQLDMVAASLRALPEVVKSVGDRTEVLMDGGVRRGSDVVVALCLGARAVLVGRAYVYGLAAGGKGGVERAIEILRKDVVRTLKLLGCASVGELSPEYLSLPREWPGQGSI